MSFDKCLCLYEFVWVEVMGVCMAFENFLPDFLDRMANQEPIIWMLHVYVCIYFFGVLKA